MRQRCEICGQEVIVAYSEFDTSRQRPAVLNADPDPQGSILYYTTGCYDFPPAQGRVYPLYSFHSCDLPEENALDLATTPQGYPEN